MAEVSDAQITGLFTVTVGLALIVNDPLPEPVQFVLELSVITTLYEPVTLALKLDTFPGNVCPDGTVHV